METPLQNHPFSDEVSAVVASEMAASLIPGLSVAALQAGKLLFVQSYGLANLELAVKADEQTVYGLASISKTFAATGIVNLARYCQLIERMEELAKKKDEGKKKSRRRGVDNAVPYRSFCFGDPRFRSGIGSVKWHGIPWH